MDNVAYRITTASRISPIEAGLGLVRADTIVATTDDQLLVTPSAARLRLTVGPAGTDGAIADLALTPGVYDAHLHVTDGEASLADKPIRLVLADPSRVVRRFGARHGSLEYLPPVVTGPDTTGAWADLWKTNEAADIVVDFDGPHKFVLWRGMSFAPSWATDNVMTSNFFAETVEPGVFRDCCEMMSDRECRYIHARVIHNSPARVVIHWRQPLADSDYRICRNQWVDEMLYVYPDGAVCRNVTIHLDPNDEDVWRECPRTGRRVPCSMIGAPAGKRTFNDMELITVNAPGASSAQNTPTDALTLLDGGDFARTFTWPTPPDFAVEDMPELDEYIFLMHYRDRPGVFVASPGPGIRARLQPNTGMRYESHEDVADDKWVLVPDMPTHFADHIHWPVTRGCATAPLSDPATFDERPTHTFLGYANNDPVEVGEDGAVTWTWLSGVAPADDEALRDKVRAWTRPPRLNGATYSGVQRAYVVDAAACEVTLTAGADGGAVVGPTLVLNGMDLASGASVTVNGTPVPAGDMAVGVERTLDTVRTIVTLRCDLSAGAAVTVRRG